MLSGWVPLTWKRHTPSVSYESPSVEFLKPDAIPPEWMTRRPLKSPRLKNSSSSSRQQRMEKNRNYKLSDLDT